MKPTPPTSLLIFVSSYSPLAVLLAVKDVDFQRFGTHSLTSPGALYAMFKHPGAVWITLFLGVISVFWCAKSFRKIRGGSPMRIRRVTPRSNDLVGYCLPYLATFWGVDLSDPAQWLGFLIFLALMFVFTIKTDSLYANPILLLLGYRLYEADVERSGVASLRTVLFKGELVPDRVYMVEKLTPTVIVALETRDNNQS